MKNHPQGTDEGKGSLRMRRRSFISGVLGSALGSPLGCGFRGLGEIAFVERDGLQIRTLPAGDARQLVRGEGICYPRFSSSGEWIAYRQEDACRVVSRDGKTQVDLGPVLGIDSAPVQWLPHDDGLVMCTPEGLQIRRASDSWKPFENLPGATLPVVFNLGGSEMVYGDVLETGKFDGGNMPIRSGRLWRRKVNASRIDAQLLLTKSMYDLIPCVWTRDGKSILYWEDEDFSGSIMADGLPLACLPVVGGSSRSLGMKTLVYDDFIAVSPKRNKLALTVGEFREEWRWKWIEVLDLDTMSRNRLTELRVVAVCPAWSLAGDRIAYSAAPAPAHRGIEGGDEAKDVLAQRKIWITDASGIRAPTKLTHDPEFRDEEPIWSADGEHLLFCRLQDSNKMTIWIMSAHGTLLRQVAGPLLLNDPEWFGYYGWIDWKSMFDWNRNLS